MYVCACVGACVSGAGRNEKCHERSIERSISVNHFAHKCGVRQPKNETAFLHVTLNCNLSSARSACCALNTLFE